MQNKDTTPATAQTSTQHTARERVGLAIYGTDSVETLSAIAAAEAAGVRQVWMTQSAAAPANVHYGERCPVATADLIDLALDDRRSPDALAGSPR